MSKSRDAFRTISEVSDALDTPAHVLRFWESKFTQVKPVKRAGGRRYYRPADVDLLAGIKQLLHDDGMTIKGAQKLLREQGVKHVAALGAAHLETSQDTAPTAPETKTAAEPALLPDTKPDPVDKPAPTGEIGITNVVPLPATPAAGPKLTLDLAAKSDPAPETKDNSQPETIAATPINVPADPSDSDSKAGARMFHLLHKARRDKLALQATAIAPLLDRMQVLRDRIDTR